MLTLVGLVAAGLGISLVPASTRNLLITGIIYRPLQGAPELAEMVLAWRQSDRAIGWACQEPGGICCRATGLLERMARWFIVGHKPSTTEATAPASVERSGPAPAGPSRTYSRGYPPTRTCSSPASCVRSAALALPYTAQHRARLCQSYEQSVEIL